MKTNLKNLFPCLGLASREAWVLPGLIAVLSLLPAGRVTAQTFTTLHSFSGFPDGSSPLAGLIVSDNTLYGTAFVGGGLGRGTVFEISAGGAGFAAMLSFDGGVGATPFAGLILSGNTLYGAGSGTVFAVNPDGTSFMTLHNFTGSPEAGLILSG